MAVGLLNPRDVSNSSNIRPADVLSGVNERRWFLSGALLHPQDVNAVLAQLRTAYDAYAIADVEGDDTALRQIFDKMLLLTGGQMSGNLLVRSSLAPIAVTITGESNTRLILTRHVDAQTAPIILVRKARGTILAPALLSQNDILGTIDFGACTDVTDPANPLYTTAVRIQASTTAASPGPSDLGSRFQMNIIPGGSASLSEILRLEHATGLSMYGTNPVIDNNRHFRLRSYTVATLPSASPANQMIRVSDMGNGGIAVSDGSVWRHYAAGTYTPTITPGGNVASSTAYVSRWVRNGNNVTVTGQLDLDPTAASLTTWGVSLPLASNLGNAHELAGVGVAISATPVIDAVDIHGDGSTDLAIFSWVAAETIASTVRFTFTYQVI